MKKVITLILAMMLLTAGCGTQSDTTDSGNEGSTTVSNAQASTETKATTAAPNTNTASSDIPAEVNDEAAIFQALQEYYDVVMAEDREKLEEIVFLETEDMSEADKWSRNSHLKTVIKSQNRNKTIYELAGMELLLPIQPFTEKYGKETYRTQVVYLQRAFITDDNGEKIMMYRSTDAAISDLYHEITKITTANMVYDKEKGKWFFSDKGEIAIFSIDQTINKAEWDKYNFVEEDRGGWIATYADKMLELKPFGPDIEDHEYGDYSKAGKLIKVEDE